MEGELLEIQPQELKFIFESKKQSFCTVRLVNKSDAHVAFNFKTTGSRKYCVTPNKGVISPNSKCDVTVMRKTQWFKTPRALIQREKLVVQNTTVPISTTYKEVTPFTFSRDDDPRKLVVEKELKVFLVDPLTKEELELKIQELETKLNRAEARVSEAETTILKLREESLNAGEQERRGCAKPECVRPKVDVNVSLLGRPSLSLAFQKMNGQVEVDYWKKFRWDRSPAEQLARGR